MTGTKCSNPPAGWTCSREAGHEGPCAASPVLEPIGKIFDEKYNSVKFYRQTGDETKRYHAAGTEFVAHDTAMELVTGLQADVETMRRKNNELNDTVAALQSELTKARELQRVVDTEALMVEDPDYQALELDIRAAMPKVSKP